MRISDWSSDVCSSDLGYLMKKFGFEPAPLVLAYVLGPMLENNFRKALILSRGDMTTFVTKPISAVCLGLAALLLLSVVRSEEHTSELQSLMRISYAVFCLKKKKKQLKRDNYTIYKEIDIEVYYIR